LKDPELLQEISRALPSCFEGDVIFIQVGSNEGVMSTDPLCAFILQHHWKGVLIEPVPRIFEKLKQNYERCPWLYFENVAISDTRKTTEFYVVDETAAFFKDHPDLVNEVGGHWGDLVGSLDKDHVLKCKPLLSENEIRTIKVECVTLHDIVDKYQLDRVDLIHIDAEGHDDTILYSIDFEKIKPKLILFEHNHMSIERYFGCIAHLQSRGYGVVYTSNLDTLVALQE
jgi:FkbM family methyltransferase